MKRSVAHRVVHHAKNHFIPHEGNDHRPYILRHRALVTYSAILILLKAAAVISMVALPSSSVYSSSITAPNIIELTNAARTALALPMLSSNALLARAAQLKAEDMLRSQYFAHTSPSGANAMTWISSVGYQPLYAGENLAVHYVTAEDVQSGWLASPTHRANIVNPRYSEVGIGIAHGAFEGADSTIVVQMFGKPVEIDAVEEAEPVKQLALATEPEPVSGIVEPSVKITSQPEGYKVTLEAPTATSVSVSVGVSTATLFASSTTGTWTGSITVDSDTLSQNGEQLNATVVTHEGAVEQVPLALVAPESKTAQVYQFADDRAKTLTVLHAFRIDKLNDSVRRVYIYFAIFLMAALLLNIFIKIKIQHASVIVHTMCVIGLAVVLLLV